MPLSFFIAWRYFFSRKRIHAVQIVSAISTAAVAAVVMVLVVILAIFNGYESILLQNVSKVAPPLQLKSTKGFIMPHDSIYGLLHNTSHVAVVAKTIFSQGLVQQGDTYTQANLLGISPEYLKLLALPQQDSLQVVPHSYILGAALHASLSTVETSESEELFTVTVPRRKGYINPLIPSTSLKSTQGRLQEVLFTQEVAYDHTLYMEVEELAQLLNYPTGACDALAIAPRGDVSTSSLKQELRSLLGAEWELLDLKDQQPDLLRLVAIEKWMAFFILFFILVLAAFNVVCSSSMLIMEKQHDCSIYHALGLPSVTLSRIFFWQSALVTLLGAVVGFLLGLLLIALQTQWGIFTFGEGFYKQPYPVHIIWGDQLLLSVVVMVIGFFSAWYPVRKLISTAN